MIVAKSLFPTKTLRLAQTEPAKPGPRWITSSKLDLASILGIGFAALLIGGAAYLLTRK